MPTTELPTRNLSLDLLRATEAAALASARYVGRGDKEGGDGAAVDAMRLLLNSTPMTGRVLIGEGEKDEAPMLYIGEEVGAGGTQPLEIAVDPVEGTSLLALGRPGAISVIAAAAKGSLMDPGPAFYAEKLVVGAGAKGTIDLHDTPQRNLERIAGALGKSTQELTVFVLDKDRHRQLIADIRSVGARISLHTDGDVSGALAALIPGSGIDVLMGTGGTPEGVMSAVAVRALGGDMQMRLNPQSGAERGRIEAAGLSSERVYTLPELCSSDESHFAATGITDGHFLRGVQYRGSQAVTHSLAIRGHTGSLRYIESHFNLDVLRGFGTVQF